ncbi:MAG: hypothetical protein JO287_14595 [Pseudonocardiales bacterium]|nr:hypothetical protein [Pseudonocardiales bacterium]
MQALRVWMPVLTLLRVSALVVLIALPIVLGIALVSLALAEGDDGRLGLGIGLLATGLLVEVVRDVLR